MKTPASLQKFQTQFGSAIATPFLWNKNKSQLQKENYPTELISDVVPLAQIFTPAERLGLYNEQYWFRLLTIMQEELPLTCSILDYYPFNQFASAYLDKYPSASPNLNDLLQFLPQFINQEHQWNTEMLKQAISLDLIHQKLFFKSNSQTWTPWELSPENLATMLENPIHLSPALDFFKEDWDLVSCLQKTNQSKEDIIVKPKASKKCWAVYKLGSRIHSEELSPFAWKLLHNLKEKMPLQEALEKTQEDSNENELLEASQQMQNWFKNWSDWQWFCQSN